MRTRRSLGLFHLTLTATGCAATAGGTLHVYVTSCCTGVFTNGDPVTVDNAYLLSPAQTITSP